MTQPDDQNNSGLRVSGYGPRVRQTLIAGIVIAAIVVAIVLAALWANSREPEMGVQPTPRPTQPPQPSATVPPPDTATPEPEEVQIPDTATPEPAIKTATPTAEAQEELVTAPAATETPVADSAPTPESTSTPAPGHADAASSDRVSCTDGNQHASSHTYRQTDLHAGPVADPDNNANTGADGPDKARDLR